MSLAEERLEARRAEPGDLPIAQVYPSQKQAATMLRVSPALLSRSGIDAIPAGGRAMHYRPHDVLELAARYKRRGLNEVAGDLIGLAKSGAPEYAAAVRAEVESFFAGLTASEVPREEFLEEARRTLPRRLYVQVRDAYDASGNSAAVQFVSEDNRVLAAD